MHNPLRSEAEAFRWVLTIGAAAGAVIALTLLTEAVYGVVLAAALLGLGVGLLWQQSRGGEPRIAEVTGGGDPNRYRLMVVANETVAGRALLEEASNRSKGRSADVLVVTPALPSSQMKHWASDIDAAVESARTRLEESLAAISTIGIEAHGQVGDSDPLVAMEDALRTFAADEIIISTHPPGKSTWLERRVVDQARATIDLPITHVVVDLEREHGAESRRQATA